MFVSIWLIYAISLECKSYVKGHLLFFFNPLYPVSGDTVYYVRWINKCTLTNLIIIIILKVSTNHSYVTELKTEPSLGGGGTRL